MSVKIVHGQVHYVIFFPFFSANLNNSSYGQNSFVEDPLIAKEVDLIPRNFLLSHRDGSFDGDVLVKIIRKTQSKLDRF
jgi:hypothetical protein